MGVSAGWAGWVGWGRGIGIGGVGIGGVEIGGVVIAMLLVHLVRYREGIVGEFGCFTDRRSTAEARMAEMEMG